MSTLRDTWIVFNRAMRLSLRNPMWSILMLSQPLMYLFLFGPLLKPITAQISQGATTNAYQVFIPGLIVQLGRDRGRPRHPGLADRADGRPRTT
jgi:ABC-2 type transport system permease protein